MDEVVQAVITAAIAKMVALFSERQSKKLKVKILRARLLKDGYKWRSLTQLARAIGQDEATTVELLLEMGARRSAGEKNVWTLPK
jgi:hypothetical protein